MPVTLVNGFVFLPHRPEWSALVDWQRTWETGISEALTGAEKRQAMRSFAREQITFTIAALSLEERVELDARLDAAVKAGQASAPYWGRGSVLAADVNAQAVSITNAAWSWQVGDYAFFMDQDFNWEVIQIEAIGDRSFTLSQAVARTYAAGSLVWPVLFGKCSVEKQNALTSWYGDAKVTIGEIKARLQTTVGNPPVSSGEGIGFWTIGTDFVVS